MGQRTGDFGRGDRFDVFRGSRNSGRSDRRLALCCFLAGVVLYLFFATALGVFLGTITRTMAQFALLIILLIIVLQMLSGGNTPIESQPEWLQRITLVSAIAAFC